MRTDIFYWKCDSPVSAEQKKLRFANGKYSEIFLDAARSAVEDFLGHFPEEMNVVNSDGNHLAVMFKDKNERLLLRADEGKYVDDDYILAESHVMNMLNRQGLPVPPVYAADISMKKYPFRYQIMQFSEFPCIQRFAEKNQLDEYAIAEQSGRYLARIHALHFPGYGFFNTECLQRDDRLQGLDDSAGKYFCKRLDDHLDYLAGHDLLTAEQTGRIIAAFDQALPALDNIRGSLLHRDYAYWNILGSCDRIEGIIDWDDCVSGDPADDFGIVNCFLSEPLVEKMLQSYFEDAPSDETFRMRIHLHTVRNMLWKTVIRDYMGYFDRGKGFFLTPGDGRSLREYTLDKLLSELEKLENLL